VVNYLMKCVDELNSLQTLSLYTIPLRYSILEGGKSIESALPRNGHMLLVRRQNLSMVGYLL
jgi:hypothetical protein